MIICQDFYKLNIVTRKCYFPFLFIDTMMDAVADHKVYSIVDGLLGSNQIQIY